MKVQVSIDDELLSRIDNYAEKTYLSRSGLVSLACTQFLIQSEVSLAIKDMALTMRKIADTGVLDKDTISKLEDFERFSKMFSE